MKNVFCLLFLFFCLTTHAQDLWVVPDGCETMWSSSENPTAEKGKAAQANKGAKGHAFERVMAGDSCVLLSHNGTGVINHIWMTVSNTSSKMLRALRIKFYWDNSNVPAVDVPLGAFFGNPLFRMTSFENCCFSNPEGRSFNCNIPMPYRKGAKVILVNTSDENLSHLFYTISFVKIPAWKNEMNYFHAIWKENESTELGNDFTILSRISGKGRFLGVSMGIFANNIYPDTWWGEGELKFYLDGDKDFPSLCSTGSEDYIGTAWSLGQYNNWYQGCPIADDDNICWSMYRFHVQDPIYFHKDIKVTYQQIGGSDYDKVLELYNAKVPLIPVSVDDTNNLKFYRLLDEDSNLHITDENFPRGFVNFFRRDHIVSTAYLYLNRPVL